MISICNRLALSAAIALILVSGCAKASPQVACKEAQLILARAQDGLNTGGPEAADRFDSAIAAIQGACDESALEIGMKLAAAHEIQGDAQAIERSLSLIKPSSPGQVQQLEMKKLDFYAARGLFDSASQSLQILRSIPADPNALDMAGAQMECRFHRCATQLETLRRLTQMYPSDAQLRGLLAFSLADRQDFENAAPNFDLAIKLNPGSLDEVSALAAVVTYCNTGQRDKARSVRELMSGGWGTFLGVSRETLQKMDIMIRDSTGKRFHFSKWPAETARPND